MAASSRMKIVLCSISVVPFLALSAQAQDAGRAGGLPPSAAAAMGSPSQNAGTPPQQAMRGAPPQGARGGPTGAPQQGHYVAHGPVPHRDWGGHAYRGN